MFKTLKREKIIEPEDVPKLIDCIDRYGLKVLKIGVGGDYRSEKLAKHFLGSQCNLTNYIFIEQTDTTLKITTKWLEDGLKACTYKLSLDQKNIIEPSGLRCFSVLQKYFKIPKIIDKPEWKEYVNETRGTFGPSASPIVGYNKKLDKREFKDCYEYDLNSAYASVMLGKIPDLDNPIRKFSIVKSGEVGFLLNRELELCHEGEVADIRFPLIDAPEGLKTFANKYYNIKKNSTGQEKIDAKAMLNLSIGYCQRYNPFFRAYIVHMCNEKIRSLIDDNTLFWNTDAIFSKVKRTDLDIGDNIGQFKEIHCNTLRYIGNNYQIDDELPTYRGVPKKWFIAAEKKTGKKYNLLTDPLPPKENIYKWNWQTLELEINKLWQEE